MTNETRIILIFLCSASIVLHLAFLVFRKRNFNYFINKLSKTEKLNFQIYGELSIKGEKSIKNYKKAILLLLKKSSTISKNIDIKFKKRVDALECEINFVGQKSVSAALLDSECEDFKNAFSSFQETMKKAGAGIVLVNKFDSKGSTVYSGVHFSISSV